MAGSSESRTRKRCISVLALAPGLGSLVAAGAHYGDPHGGDARVGLAALCFGAVYLVACVVAAQAQKSALLKIAALGWSASIAMCAGYFVLTWDPPKPDFRLQADGYEGMDWVEDYYKEFLESNQTNWQPYVYWRRPPYAGKQIHVDDEGLRRTWIDTKAPDDAPRVFMLGGSTMWGTGARDDETIPSFLARSLSKEGVPVRVHNYGETGYVSTQCLIRLLLELRRGNVPDVVVTYDGANDMYSGFQTKQAGIPQNEIRRRQDYLRGSGRRPPPTPKLGPDELVEQVVVLYRANLRVVASLGREYGFELCAFWQPSLFFRKPLTEYERGRVKKRSSEMAEFFRAGHAVIAGLEFPSYFLDLSGAFASQTAPRYVDWCHITPTANEEIAQAMLPRIRAALQEARRASD